MLAAVVSPFACLARLRGSAGPCAGPFSGGSAVFSPKHDGRRPAPVAARRSARRSTGFGWLATVKGKVVHVDAVLSYAAAKLRGNLPASGEASVYRKGGAGTSYWHEAASPALCSSSCTLLVLSPEVIHSVSKAVVYPRRASVAALRLKGWTATWLSDKDRRRVRHLIRPLPVYHRRVRGWAPIDGANLWR